MGQIHNTKHPSEKQERKRVGRGDSSGHGKTCGRGTKGQKARAGNALHPRFTGGNKWILAFPKLPGFTRTNKKEYQVINVGELDRYDHRDEFDPEWFDATGIATRKIPEVKVLGDGELNRSITVKAHAFSESAREQIEEAGGEAIVVGDDSGEEEEE